MLERFGSLIKISVQALYKIKKKTKLEIHVEHTYAIATEVLL